MREWTKPEINELTLEPAEDVLKYCYSAASNSPSKSFNACTNNNCFTAP